MKNIRIGNDIKIVWALCDESGPISLLDKSVCVFLQNRYDKIHVENFEVSGNIISFTFFGQNQRVGGDYSLVFGERRFNLLRHTHGERGKGFLFLFIGLRDYPRLRHSNGGQRLGCQR